MALDPFNQRDHALTKPARSLRAVTPHDTNEIDTPQGLFITASGTLTVLGVDDTVTTPLGTVAAGTLLPFRVKKVMATGTTATVLAVY